jgi:hypothetical protein
MTGALAPRIGALLKHWRQAGLAQEALARFIPVAPF